MRKESGFAARLRWRRVLFIGAVLSAAALGLIEGVTQYQESRYVRAVAHDVIERSGAQGTRARIVALRDYLRANVSFHGALHDDRPFLRASAADTLRSGKGYCGEVTRAFICMADAVGIKAQRINLWGASPHVAAEAEVAPGDWVIVDSQNPPQIAELEQLDQVILRAEYSDYSTINLRRLRLEWLISRTKIQMGPLTYWTENPHALKALFWFLLGLGCPLCWAAVRTGRSLVGSYLYKRGWVHVSHPRALADALVSSKTLEPNVALFASARTERDLNSLTHPEARGNGGASPARESTTDEVARSVDQLISALRCPGCQGGLEPEFITSDSLETCALACRSCYEKFPVVDGIPRMLLSPMREALNGVRSDSAVDPRLVATARSFGFEWSRFHEMYDEWERNFFEYMSPRGPEFFRGKRVLDVGCGSGRHAYYAALSGAEVWAIDLGATVEVARRNTSSCEAVHVVQADLHDLPFEPHTFDFIYSIGVLHHLPDPEAAFRNLLRFLKPGAEVQIYLYWEPDEQPLKRALLSLVTAVRRVTTQLPHRVVYGLAFPAACLAFLFFVWPYKVLRRIPGLRRFAERIPMKQYESYPFRVCVNDQFDRFSAPIENRYTKREVEDWLRRANLEDIQVRPNCGWGGSGRIPAAAPAELAGSVAEVRGEVSSKR